MMVQHLHLQHRMRADAIVEQTGLALPLVESIMDESDNGRKPYPQQDPLVRAAEARAQVEAIGLHPLGDPVIPEELTYDSAEIPIGPPEE